jgi:hypothetical protein
VIRAEKPSIRARLDILSSPDFKRALTIAWAAPEPIIIRPAMVARFISETEPGRGLAEPWNRACADLGERRGRVYRGSVAAPGGEPWRWAASRRSTLRN